jgi:hypothetical protein
MTGSDRAGGRRPGPDRRKLRLEQQWAAGVDVQAVVAENQRVHRELDRMRGLLREHGIEPDEGTAQTA